MRSILFLAAGVLLAGPAVAADASHGLPPASSPLYSGTSLYTGHVEFDFTLATRKGDTIVQGDAVGRLAGPLGGWLKGEGELLGLIYHSGGETEGGVGGVGHLYKDAPTHALGLVGGVVSAGNRTTFALGVEGKLYFQQNALTGQVAYVRARDKYDYTNFGGEFDHYFTPNMKGVTNFTYFDRRDTDSALWAAVVGVEKRIAGSRWSVSGSGGYMATTGHSPSSAWMVRVGARMFFDDPGTTLEQHDRLVPFNGAWVTTMAH